MTRPWFDGWCLLLAIALLVASIPLYPPTGGWAVAILFALWLVVSLRVRRREGVERG